MIWVNIKRNDHHGLDQYWMQFNRLKPRQRISPYANRKLCALIVHH